MGLDFVERVADFEGNRREFRASRDDLGSLRLDLRPLRAGTGLRLLEALRLRFKDLDFTIGQITVRSGKGDKDRVTMLPAAVVARLREHLEKVKAAHTQELAQGYGDVELPHALSRKYPSAAKEWGWQYVFPAPEKSHAPRSGAFHRHHLYERNVQRAFRRAAQKAGLAKHATCHTLRHSFATHLLQAGYAIRTVQGLLGHRSVKPTMIYTHVLNRGGRGVQSPADLL